jgi:outer membrane protein insertion porin family
VTHEDVIRERIYLLPGDIYSEEALLQSYQSIMGLGFFESPMPMPRIEPTETGDVDVTFEVKEKQTGSINFGTSVGGWGGLAGFLGYDQPNLFGQAKAGHLRWEFGKYSNNFEASYTDPAVAGTRISSSLSVFNTKYGYGRMFSFNEGEQRQTGAGLRFGVPFPLDPLFSRVFVGYSLSRTKYSAFDETGTSLFNLPPGMKSTVSLGLTRQTLNHPIFPTNGSRQEIQGEFSGGPLGGDGNFQKYTFSGSWWVPVASLGGGQPGLRPIRTALGITAEAGALFGDAGRFPFERFWLGGVQFGKPLRGYDETTITPGGYAERENRGIALQDRMGDAYLRLSAEYAVRFNDNISLSLFYDAGNVWRRAVEINPTRLYRGAGVGLTLVTPFGPLGLDYAYGFDKTDPGWKLHFKFGQGF